MLSFRQRCGPLVCWLWWERGGGGPYVLIICFNDYQVYQIGSLVWNIYLDVGGAGVRYHSELIVAN